MEHVKLEGGPADGRKLVVKDSPETVTVAPNQRRPDPSRPRRHRGEGKRDCRYRRTDRGVGTGLIPKRYVFVP